MVVVHGSAERLPCGSSRDAEAAALGVPHSEEGVTWMGKKWRLCTLEVVVI